MKKILGLDLGTNSIGWAVIENEVNEQDNSEHFKKIASAGSRIIPMDQTTLSDFNSGKTSANGNIQSPTAQRTAFRGVRRRYDRCALRRERLCRVLRTMGFLPEHYLNCLDKYGKLIPGTEPKIEWGEVNGQKVFLFEDTFREMVEEFRKKQPSIAESEQKVSHDWLIYYLRKKALTQAVSKYELAWILLNFNQKRGYNQRESSESNEEKIEQFYTLEVLDIKETGEKKGKKIEYQVIFKNDDNEKNFLGDSLTYTNTYLERPEWIGLTKNLIVSWSTENGLPKKDKEGNIKYSIRIPKDDDWALLKKKTEKDIASSKKTLGAFIYDRLLENPTEKIRGKYVRTIDREFYRKELILILNEQKKYIPELTDKQLYANCVFALYPQNDKHRQSIADRDFTYLLADDIIIYQRPLKSKKSLIANCQYENRTFVKDGKLEIAPLKCIPKSNPFFQEFRLWQFIANLRIVDNLTREDVTAKYIHGDSATSDKGISYEGLFKKLNEKKEISCDNILSILGIKNKKSRQAEEDDTAVPVQERYRWRYVLDKKYPGNTTRNLFLRYFKKAGLDGNNYLDKPFDNYDNTENTTLNDRISHSTEYFLWHLLYSVNDRGELKSALRTFATKIGLQDDAIDKFANTFIGIPQFKSEYGSYSEKAIKKMLPLMRCGTSFWNENDIDSSTKERIEKLINGEADDNIRERIRKATVKLDDITEFQGLPTWLAGYVVYNRHSEADEGSIAKWDKPEDIDKFLDNFKQHSMHNPIVESVVLETMRTVRDIWKQEGKIDEIHLEMSREMRSPAEERERLTKQITQNENMNQEMRERLLEHFGGNEKMLTSSNLLRYRLWREQGEKSAYTGQPISLGNLFSSAYEVDHIIPQAKYYDDSLSNKVLCEAGVNSNKSARLGHEYIKAEQGKTINCNGTIVTVRSIEDYEKWAREQFAGNPKKRDNLLADDIPQSFINRQLNDSRYISRYVKGFLSNVVRTEQETSEAISKNVVVCTGSITDRLKLDWGIKSIWEDILLPRFKRMEGMRDSENVPYVEFRTIDDVDHCGNMHVKPGISTKYGKGFQIKRLDHRHHAMDAIVIACANRSIVNFLSNEHTHHENSAEYRYDLKKKLCYTDNQNNHKGEIKPPADDFALQVKTALENIVVSFKHKERILTKGVNRTQYLDSNGKICYKKQEDGDFRSLRQPYHKETAFGKVALRDTKTENLNKALTHSKDIMDRDIRKAILECQRNGLNEKQIKKVLSDKFQDRPTNKLDVYYFTDNTYAVRTNIDANLIKSEKDIEKITDKSIREILRKHLANNEGNAEKAFSPEGLERMNANIQELNGGKAHKPVYKCRKFEPSDAKFPLGHKGIMTGKYFEAQKGTNLFLAVYRDSDGKRSYRSIPLVEVVDCIKNGLPKIPEKNLKGEDLLFYLSPNDLVYVPTSEEIDNRRINATKKSDGTYELDYDKSRIYKFVSCTGTSAYFVPAMVATSIVDKVEFSQLNKTERIISITGEQDMIKSVCIPIKTDRLGNIVKIDETLL